MKKISEYKDFPIFNYWESNRQEFEPRALNELSVRFNDYLDKRSKKFQKADKDDLLNLLVHEIINATKYSMFGNSSYEAHYHDDSHGGGFGSIQQQFTCWVLGISEEEYESGLSYGPELYQSENLRNWILGSDLYKDLKGK